MTIDLSVFKNQGDDTDVERDSLGWEPKNTDVYASTIKQAYLDQSDKGAFFVHFELEFKDQTSMRYDLYFTNRDGDTRWQKGKRSGNMPGFNKLNSLVEVVLGIGNEFSDLQHAEKKVEVRSGNENTLEDKDVLIDLLGKSVLVGITRELGNKSAKNDTGGYDPIAETREYNEIHKFYQAPKGFTANELRDGEDTPVFVTDWLGKNKGKVMDKRTIKDAAAAASSSGTKAQSTTPIFN